MITSYYILAIWLVLSYFLGSVPAGIVVSAMWRGADPRKYGSKNPGTTNMLRINGKGAALCTLLGDVLKSFLPALLVKLNYHDHFAVALVVIASFVGHIYPIFFNFNGGKGVATFLGGMAALNWLLGVYLIAIWVATALISKYSSVAAITMASMAPMLSWYLLGYPECTIIIAMMSVILLLRHCNNINNLLNKREPQLL